MTVQLLKGKIHRAAVTQAELDYVGSITVDEALLEASGIREYEKVQIVDVNNGSRFETYTICGERGSGMICLNGAAARCVSVGDKIIIMAYADLTEEEAENHKPKVVFVDEENRICRVTHYFIYSKASVENTCKHCTVNVDTDILNKNICRLLSIERARVFKLIEVVDELQKSLNNVLRVGRRHNCTGTCVLKLNETAVVNRCNNTTLCKD